MSEEFTHRMGVNTSSVQSTENGLVTSNLGGDSCTPAYRDTMGALRYNSNLLKHIFGWCIFVSKYAKRVIIVHAIMSIFVTFLFVNYT